VVVAAAVAALAMIIIKRRENGQGSSNALYNVEMKWKIINDE
jgi:hypothetical protein